VAKTTALDTYYVSPAPGDAQYISHFSEPKASVLEKSKFDATRHAGRSATHVFPGGHFSPNPGTGFMHLMRSIPTSPTTTRQEYDVYRLNTPGATAEAHERMTKLYQRVVGEDFELCEKVQRNLERGIFETGPVHPFHEEGVRAFQLMLLEILRDQVRREEAEGKEIWAAKPKAQRLGTNNALADHRANGNGVDGRNLCEQMLGCDKTRLPGLEW